MEEIRKKLLKYKKKTITLDELTNLAGNSLSYDNFYSCILVLEKESILQRVKSSGDNGLSKSLGNKYRLNKGPIEKDKNNVINSKILTTHPSISLEFYFTKSLDVFTADEPFIDMINEYISKNGLPTGLLQPELAYELTGNEKWIEQGRGKQILKRLKLMEPLAILKESDPISFAINKERVNEKVHKHLIVENKTTYIHMMDGIEGSFYNTVIYGQGWKITAGLSMFERQYPFGESHEFYYFGDVDSEGLSIFLNLKERYDIMLAGTFYQALFNKTKSAGKENQRYNEEKIKAFVAMLSGNHRQQHDGQDDDVENKSNYILEMLKHGYYQPQEVLSREELITLLRGYEDD